MQKNNSHRITDLAEPDRPRERLLREGPSALSNAELLAILLRTGTRGQNALEIASSLLIQFQGISGIHQTDPLQLRSHGVGLAKIAMIKAGIELGTRISQKQYLTKRNIRKPEDVYELFGPSLRAKEQEEFWVISLDVRKQIRGVDELYKGSQDSATIKISEVFKGAIRRNAHSLIAVHNHPSGDPTESLQDLELTRSLIQAARALDLSFEDHIVVADSGFRSIRNAHPSLWASSI